MLILAACSPALLGLIVILFQYPPQEGEPRR